MTGVTPGAELTALGYGSRFAHRRDSGNADPRMRLIDMGQVEGDPAYVGAIEQMLERRSGEGYGGRKETDNGCSAARV